MMTPQPPCTPLSAGTDPLSAKLEVPSQLGGDPLHSTLQSSLWHTFHLRLHQSYPQRQRRPVERLQYTWQHTSLRKEEYGVVTSLDLVIASSVFILQLFNYCFTCFDVHFLLRTVDSSLTCHLLMYCYLKQNCRVWGCSDLELLSWCGMKLFSDSWHNTTTSYKCCTYIVPHLIEHYKCKPSCLTVFNHSVLPRIVPFWQTCTMYNHSCLFVTWIDLNWPDLAYCFFKPDFYSMWCHWTTTCI